MFCRLDLEKKITERRTIYLSKTRAVVDCCYEAVPTAQFYRRGILNKSNLNCLKLTGLISLDIGILPSR